MSDQKRPVIVDLPEGLLLLATDDASGQISSNSGALNYGLTGAVLTELFLQERLIVDSGSLVVSDGELPADPILADVLNRIANSKPRDARHWVKKLPGADIKAQLLERLVGKGILRKEEHRILWVIPADRYPAEDDAPERDVRDAVRAAVLSGSAPPPRIAVLIGILKACDLLDTVFSREERKVHRDRIDQIASAELMGKAVSKAVKDMQAATMAAITAATTAAVVSSSASS